MTAEQQHLAWLRLKGRSAASVYSRQRALARLAAWLEARETPAVTEPGEGSPPGVPRGR